MSNAIRISRPIKPLQRKKYNYFVPEVSSFLQNLSVSSRETASLVKHSLVCFTKTHTVTDQIAKLTALTRDDPLQDHDPPVSVELEPVSNESQFDRVMAEAQQFEESVIVIWMASWCRKCIYLKPKLERLAAEYYPRIRFYCVDVNAVRHKLVARAGVTKMPTIQMWKDSKKQAEVIGGHKAYLVVNEVREMIENESTL